MVYIGFQSYTRNSIRHARYSCQERMASNLELQYNFLYGSFTCNLPEDTIDVEVTVHTLKGIHTF